MTPPPADPSLRAGIASGSGARAPEAAISSAAEAVPTASVRWTCPFCPLLCDDLLPRRAEPAAGGWQLDGGRCPRAQAALAAFDATPAPASAQIDGRPCSLNDALDAAAALLGAAQAPLFGGLGTDVAGARALFALAGATGAVCDAAQGPALMSALRALQDRGGYTTTLAELRGRADLVICIGGLPDAAAPRFFERPAGTPAHSVLQLGGAAPVAHAGRPPAEQVAGGADLFDTLAALAVAVQRRGPAAADPAIERLAQRLADARYAVLVGEPARWGDDAGLVVEAVNHIVHRLNQRGRAAALWLGGGDGAASVNQTFAWLSGLPLRSRAGPAGLEHEPLAWDARRLLADGAVDALLWLAAFPASGAGGAAGAAIGPPEHALPMVVLALPRLALPPRAAPTVFIPVATPGIDSAGHLIRTDGTVLLPLYPIAALATPALPTVADVVHQLTLRLRGAGHG